MYNKLDEETEDPAAQWLNDLKWTKTACSRHVERWYLPKMKSENTSVQGAIGTQGGTVKYVLDNHCFPTVSTWQWFALIPASLAISILFAQLYQSSGCGFKSRPMPAGLMLSAPPPPPTVPRGVI